MPWKLDDPVLDLSGIKCHPQSRGARQVDDVVVQVLAHLFGKCGVNSVPLIADSSGRLVISDSAAAATFADATETDRLLDGNWQTAVAANGSRKYLLVANESVAQNLRVYLGNTPGSHRGVLLAPGGSLEFRSDNLYTGVVCVKGTAAEYAIIVEG